ncbi:MAG TPA: menaquinone biosynthesis protein [bacterium]|nr:menaquinone biosynthesis protein [bacterium]
MPAQNKLLAPPLRVGKISYANCLPFYYGLQKHQDPDFFESYPVKINQAMRHGKMDIAPISSLEYLNHQKDYRLLPFSIGARDFTGSVILFSHEKIEGLNGVPIALSRESLSSVALLKILLKLKFKFKNKFVVTDSNPREMLSNYRAALVIGDGALFYQPREFVYKYDLVELWWNWTGKPFCFALWAVRRAFAEDHPEEVERFVKKLKQNLEMNLADIESLIHRSLGLTFLDEKFSRIFGYLFNLNYYLDTATGEGLDLFFRLANRIGISPRPEPLDFF